MNKSIGFILIVVFLLACAMPPALQQVIATPTSPGDCIGLEISDEDVDHLLNYRNDVFQTSDWTRGSYTVEADQVYVTYSHNTLYGVGFVDELILCNAATTVKDFGSDENIALMLANYDSYEMRTSCHKDNLFLYELSATEETRDYNAYIWLTPLEDPNHALEVMLVIPKENPEVLARYAEQLFPELPSCR